MCDCGEEGCVFTEAEAKEFEGFMKEYRRVMSSDLSKLSESDECMKSIYLQGGQPPWMEDKEWKELQAKNQDFKPDTRSPEEQMFSEISAVITPKKANK
jgi:hypothetical protein